MGKAYQNMDKYIPVTPGVPRKAYQDMGNAITGAEYLGGKVAAGAASIGIGAWNFIAGTFDQLTGNDYAAEKRYAENSATAFSQKLDQQYDANGFMGFVGAVGEGVGQFIPTALLSLIPVAGGVLATGTQFAAYTGMNVEEAYKKTGELGAREYIYGAAMGGFETALEFVGGKVGGWLGGTKVGGKVTGKLLGVSDNAAKALSGKVGARAATIGTRTVFGGASEFTEEFIEAYAEVGLQRVMEIDPNASVTFAEAARAGAIGFFSGAAISGATSVLNTKGAQMTGARVMKAGEADMTVSAAVEIASSFKSTGRVESGVHKMLKDNLALWEGLTDKTSGNAQMVLGNIQVCMDTLAGFAKQQGVVRTVTTNPEKFLPYAQALFGKEITLEDLKSSDSRVVRFLAASHMATGEADALAIRAKRIGVERAIAQEKDGVAAIQPIGKEWNGGDAIYKAPDGEYVIISENKNGDYTVMKGKDIDNLTAYSKGENSVLTKEEALAAYRDLSIAAYSKPEPEQTAQESEEVRNSISPASAEANPEEKKAEKPKKKPTEAENKKGEATEGEAEEAPAEGEKEGEKKKANKLSNQNARERARLIDEYDAEVQDKAAKILGKQVYALSADRRIAVYEAIRSGKNVSADVLNAACYFISKRPGLFIHFGEDIIEDNKGNKKAGFRRVLFGGKARVVFAANGPRGLRKILVHEIFHDIAHTAAGRKLIRAALEDCSAEMAYDTAVRYGKHYADNIQGVESFETFFKEGKYEKEDHDSVLKAILAYEEKYKDILPSDAITEELVGDVVSEVIGNEKFLKMAKDTNSTGIVLRWLRRMMVYLKTKKAAKPLYAIACEYEDLFLSAVNQGQGTWDAAVQGVGETRYNLKAVATHLAKLDAAYNGKESSVELEELKRRYEEIVKTWKRIGGELDSKFLNEWNEKVGKDRAFTVFKAQAGYKYNAELSSMCKKGVPLFEAIDTIVKKEVSKQLDSKVISKQEKEILYDILKSRGFEIPCAICYVEQARQREGVIIDAFLNGSSKGEDGVKIGWNSLLADVQKEMNRRGVDYTFPSLDRSVATDAYSPANLEMTEEEQNAFYAVLKKLANEEISRYNREQNKQRPLLTGTTPDAVKAAFKGTLPSNLKVFKTLFQEPSSRFTIADDLLYSSETTQNLAAYHNALYGLFNSQGGVSGYKTKQKPVVYWGDMLGKTWRPKTLRDHGGIRNQSNSDFQIYTLLDQVQMYVDLTAKGYYLQAYTKVLAELKLFGLSGAKINASLIPRVHIFQKADGSIDVERTRANAGLDEKGQPIYDDFEGIPHEEAFMLIEDAQYSKSVGGVCIGYSDKHISTLLDDDRVQLIIGFHDKTNDPKKRYRGAVYAKNYNGINEAVDANGKTVHIGFNTFVSEAEGMFKYDKKTETFTGTATFAGKTYEANDIPRLAADLYLASCAKKGYAPAYSGRDGGVDFSKHRNYYKLLADFSLYDSEGNYAPHKRVAFSMPENVPYLDENGKRGQISSDEYIKRELEKELKVRDDVAAALADTSEDGIISEFVRRANALQEDSETRYSLSDSDHVTESDVEDAFGLIWDQMKEGRAYSHHKSVKDFLANETDLEMIDYYAGAFDFVEGENPLDKIEGLYDEVLLSDVIEAYRNGTLDTLKIKAEATEIAQTETPKTWRDEVESLYATISEGISESAKNRIPSLDEVFSSERGAIGGFKAVTRMVLEAHKDYKSGEMTYDEFKHLERTAYKIENIMLRANALQDDGETRYSLADRDYLAAVERGDTATAQKMVDEAAHKAMPHSVLREGDAINKGEEQEGTLIKMYHGSGANNFHTFKPQDGALGKGVYITSNWDEAVGYAMEKLGVQESEDGNSYVWNGEEYDGIGAVGEALEAKGYVRAFYANVTNSDDVASSSVYWEDVIALVRDTNDLKSADAITYDDKGNVIPLSERFNTENDDIRYSLSTDSTGTQLTEAQEKFFRDSKVRDKKGNLQVMYHGTTANFSTFKKGDVGFHFGTKGAARGRVGYGKNAIIKEVYLNITNPIEFNEDLGSWDADYLLTRELFDKGILTKEEAESVLFTDDKMFKRSTDAANKKLSSLLLSKGYDGIAYPNTFETKKATTSYIVFESKQAKEVTNTAPTDNPDIRYSLVSEEEYARARAVRTVEKSKARRGVSQEYLTDATARAGAGKHWLLKNTKGALASLIKSGKFSTGEYNLKLKADDLNDVSRYLWEQLNKGKEQEAAEVVSDFLLARMLSENVAASQNKENANEARRILKPYYHKLRLDESSRAELRAALGENNAKVFINLFGSSDGNGVSIDADAAEINDQFLSAELGLRLDTENDKNALIGFAKAYFQVRTWESEWNADGIAKAAETIFADEESLREFREQTKEAILKMKREDGADAMIRHLLQQKEAAYDRLYEKWRETQQKYEGAVKLKYSAADAVFLAREVGEMVSKRKYVNAAEIITPEMEAVGKTLASLATPRKLKDKEVRQVMKILSAWYTPQNLDADSASEKEGEAIETSMYHPDIKAKMEEIANGQENAQLTYEEIRKLAEVLAAVRKVIQNYDMVTLNGHRVRATEAAVTETSMLRDYIDHGGAGKGDKGGFIGKMFHNAGAAVGKKLKDNFLYRAMTPRQVIQSLEWYDKNGVLTQAFDAIQDGVAGAGSDYADMMRPVMEFYDEHKKYEKRLSKTFIPYEGEEMTVGQAIALYMTTKREQAALGFQESGFRFMGKDGKVRDARPRAAEDVREEISAALSAEDKAYIKVLERVFEHARDLKVKTDGEVFGYTNVEDGYYFPISRDTMEIAKRVSDIRQTMRDIAVVGNKSFNKNTVKNAKNALFIADVTMVTDAHAMGVAQYANLYLPLSSWDRLWNKKVEGKDGNKTSTRRLVSDEIWTGKNNRDIADAYFRQLFADIQGVRAEKRDGESFYASLRATYVSAALGFNLSSILKQTGSFASAYVYLSVSDLSKGLVMKGDKKEMWKYSKVANGRMFEQGRFVNAESNARLENASRVVRKFGEKTMVGVEAMDNLVVGRLWNACQLNVARTQGLAVGTEENKVAAGKLLDKVINETQSSSTQDTRSALQRGNTFMQTMTMFTSDAVKQVSFLYEGAARLYSAKLRKKMGKGSDAEVKEAKRFLRKSITGFAASTALIVAIAQFIKWLLGREREEGESIAEDIAQEAFGQVIGIVPIVSDIYGKVANNYDVDSFAFEAINDVLDGAIGLWGNLMKVANGENVSRQDLLRPTRNLVYSLGNFTGIPVRNIANYVVGVSKKISPEAGYSWDALFEAPSYEKDIAKAIAEGNEDLAAYIMELAIRHRVAEGDYDSALVSELLYFANTGEDVTPDKLPGTINGVPVSAEQYKQMQKIYGGSAKVLEEMVLGDAYLAQSDEEKISSINTVYRTYLNLAKARVMPAEDGKRTAAVWVAPLLSGAQSYAVLGKISKLESTDDKTRSEQVTEYLNELDMSNDERYLVLFAAGYRSENVLKRVRKLIAASDKLTAEEKAAFEKQYAKEKNK